MKDRPREFVADRRFTKCYGTTATFSAILTATLISFNQGPFGLSLFFLLFAILAALFFAGVAFLITVIPAWSLLSMYIRLLQDSRIKRRFMPLVCTTLATASTLLGCGLISLLVMEITDSYDGINVSIGISMLLGAPAAILLTPLFAARTYSDLVFPKKSLS